MRGEKSVFADIKAGLEEAVRHARGDDTGAVEHQIVVESIDVAAIREKLGLSQVAFAEAFGVSAGTVRNWEQGLRRPRGAARVLLKVIDRRPEVVQQVLAESAA